MRHKKFLLNSVLAVGMSLVLTACGTTTASKQGAVNVRVTPISAGTITTNVEYASKLKPIQTVNISPKANGKVASLLADVGNEVKQGQTLLTLDSTDLQAQAQQQQANVEANQANYEKAKSTTDQQILQAEQTQQTNQIAYDSAKDTYDKDQILYNAGAISKQGFDTDKQKMDQALIALNEANANLNLLTEQLGPQSVQSASAQVRQAESSANYASIQVQNTILTSPIDGIVSNRNFNVGEMTSSATPAFTIIDTKTVVAEISVPDKALAQIKKDQTVSVKISSMNNKELTGTISLIKPDADSKTNSYIVDVNLDNSSNELKSGMFARVILPSEQKDNVLTVPNEAITMDAGVSYVYAVKNNAVNKIPVELGIANDKITEIVSGLKPGDNIITEGQIFLNDGQKVNVAK